MRARRFDVLVVSSVECVISSSHEFVVLVDLLRSYECEFTPAREPALDTTGAHGALLGEVVSTFAAFERDVRLGRQRVGLEMARPRLGRPRQFSVERARELHSKKHSYAEIAEMLGVSKAAVARAIVSKPPIT